MQEAPAASVPPVRLTDEEPAAAVAVPPQVLLRPEGVDTTRPAGKVSVNARPFNAELTLLSVMVKVRLVEPFNGMLAAPNAFVILGGLMTVRMAEDVDVAPVLAAVELIVTVLL